MDFRFRLVPLVILAAVGLLGVKLGEVWLALDTGPIATARAEPASEVAKPAAETTKPAGVASPLPGVADKSEPPDPLSMSPVEVELLQKLADRRAEIEKRAAELSQREVLLEAAEKRVDEKIVKLETLKKDIGGVVDQQAEVEDARIKSLVKIYETMKPHDAARIFEQLDMPVLLGVVGHMKERNAAPILAAMDPTKAKAVTLALAQRNEPGKSGAPAQQAPQKAPVKP